MGYAKRGFSSWSNRFRRGQVGTAGLASGIQEAFASLQNWSSINICSSPVPRSLSLPLPSPPAICLCFCCLSTTHQHISLCGPSERPALHWPSTLLLHGQDQQSHLHPTVTQGAYHKLYLLHHTPFLVDCGPLDRTAGVLFASTTCTRRLSFALTTVAALLAHCVRSTASTKQPSKANCASFQLSTL